MINFFRQMFTGKDNRTIDIGRILWFESIQAFIGLTIYHIYNHGVFDPVTWGGGLAALLAAGGAALGLKGGVEPEGRKTYGDYVKSAMSGKKAVKYGYRDDNAPPEDDDLPEDEFPDDEADDAADDAADDSSDEPVKKPAPKPAKATPKPPAKAPPMDPPPKKKKQD
jgi:hypothetical protein